MEAGRATRGNWLGRICWHEESITWSTLPDCEAKVSPYLTIDTCPGGPNTASPHASQLAMRGVNEQSRCRHKGSKQVIEMPSRVGK